MNKRLYYKGLNDNLCGKNNFQYAIGEIFTAGTDDPWHWLYFTKKVTRAIPYGKRIVEVMPITAVRCFGGRDDRNARTIRIVRELFREEILEKLIQEKCPFYKMVYIEPTYEELLRYRDYIKPCDHYSICCEFDWLTEDQKMEFLPKWWESRVHGRFCALNWR